MQTVCVSSEFFAARPSALVSRLLRAIRLPTLIDQIGVYVIGILFAQQIVEPLHAVRGERTVQHDVLEGRMQIRTQFAQVMRLVFLYLSAALLGGIGPTVIAAPP